MVVVSVGYRFVKVVFGLVYIDEEYCKKGESDRLLYDDCSCDRECVWIDELGVVCCV